MSLLKNLKKAETIADLAKILGFQPQKVSYILFKIPADQKYHEIILPKKNGGKRIIRAPDPRLKTLQRRLANLLNECLVEIVSGKNQRVLAHGFKKGHSIQTNAKLHKNKRYVLNFDLENFFPSINFGRVRGFFIKNRDFELKEGIATLIAQIACHENELPQGSPCSPVISNLIGHLLDIRLVQIAKKYKCTYSRYADDITFSTNQKVFPKEIAFQNKKNPEIWQLGKLIETQVDKTGFKINSSKTRLRYKDFRQMVTGMVVNDKVNVRSEYYKLARAMSHSLFSRGFYEVPGVLSPVDKPELPPAISKESQLKKLEGILGHILYTRTFSDSRSRKVQKKDPTAIWKLMNKFLFYKYFGMQSKPLIICEGITDPIYLKIAIKKNFKKFPSLIGGSNKPFSFKIRFFNYTRNTRDVLGLGGGTGDLAKLVGTYNKKVKNYPAWSPESPVIILTDNDEAATKVFSAVKTNSTSLPSINTNDDFYHINNNLYLVKIPHLPKKKAAVIEDLFDKKWGGKKLGNKKFSPEDNFDKEKFYGKRIFAEVIIAKNVNQVDFEEFIPLLERLEKVLVDFSKKS